MCLCYFSCSGNIYFRKLLYHSIWHYMNRKLWTYILLDINFCLKTLGRRGRDRMVVEFTTTYAIGAYHHWCCEFESWSGCTTLCDKVCLWLATGRWFSPGAPVSSTKKPDRHDITEVLLKVALNTIKQTNNLKTYGETIKERTI